MAGANPAFDGAMFLLHNVVQPASRFARSRTHPNTYFCLFHSRADCRAARRGKDRRRYTHCMLGWSSGMDCIEALRTRRSIRAYTGEPVS